MNLKKVLSFVAAAAMAVCLSAPVLAESTPGQAANELANAAAAEVSIEGIGSKVEAITDKFVNAKQNGESATVSVAVTSQALRYFDLMEENQQSMAKKEVGNLIYRCDAGTSVNVNKSEIASDNTITVDATSDVASAHGYALSVKLPLDCNVKKYEVTETEGSLSFTAVAEVKEIENQFKLVTFWVPHFTTYVLNPIADETPAATATPTATAAPAAVDDIQYYTCPACGYHNWTATDEGYRCDNCGYIESQKQLSGYGNVKGVYTPATGAENPIKATGSDMNRTVFVVVALAVAAACGMGYAAKKSGKAE